MESNVNLADSVPSALCLAQLSDAELLAGTRRLVGRSNQLLAELLLHLGSHAHTSPRPLTGELYDLSRRVPPLDRQTLPNFRRGREHYARPHLERNLVEVLTRAKHRTKRELARLVRLLDPLPAVPARIEPLGPAPARPSPRRRAGKTTCSR